MGNTRRTACLFVIAAAALVGCGLSEPLLVEQEKDLQDIKLSQTCSKGWKVDVLPVEAVSGVEEKEDVWPLSVRSGPLRDGVIAALRETGVFAEVGRKEDFQGDLSLSLRVSAAKAAYTGGNENRIAWFLTWALFSSYVAAFIADEDYSADMGVEAVLTDKLTGAILWQDRIMVEFAGSLDHFQRGISIWDLFLPGPFLTGADNACLSDVLVPHLGRKLEIELARRMSAAVPVRQVDLLVAVGAGRVQAADKSPSFCEADAQAFVASFARRDGRTETVLLVGEKATSGALNDVLKGYSERKNITIRDLVVYFAGCGVLTGAGEVKAEAALVFAPVKDDVAPGQHPRSLAVTKLLELVKMVPAESRLVILDAGFKGTVGRVAQDVQAAPASSAVQALPAGKDIPALFASCGPEETAFESPEVKAGLFTNYLLTKLNAEGDTDGDGRVVVKEVIEDLSWNVLRESRFLGSPSTTFHSGEGILFRCKPKPRETTKEGGSKPEK